jgi:hypothetical protein
MLGGMIGDKYSQKYKKTNAMICMIGALLAMPLIGSATIF